MFETISSRNFYSTTTFLVTTSSPIVTLTKKISLPVIFMPLVFIITLYIIQQETSKAVAFM